MKKEENELKWYMNGKRVTNYILIVILAIILCSQSFANSTLSLALFTSVINHNSVYLLVFVYFILIQFSFGKKYFNYLNVFLIFVYFFVMFTSVLTLVQSFSLNTVLNFVLNFLLIIYLIHTLFRDSRVWEEFQLTYSPFNELTNEWLYNSIVIVSVFVLAVDLISTVVFSGVVISFLDFVYHILFGRYIFLYREYLDKKKLDYHNKGNFDEVRARVNIVLDKTEIDDVIVDGVKDVKDKVDAIVEEYEIHEKIDAVKDKIQTTSNDVKKQVHSFLTEEVDPKKKKKKVSKKGDK